MNNYSESSRGSQQLYLCDHNIYKDVNDSSLYIQDLIEKLLVYDIVHNQAVEDFITLIENKNHLELTI